MDDYNITSLYESQNEWVARLVNILTPEIIKGFREMLREAINLCNENEEYDKYLMTLQNFMARVSKWNETIIKNETERIIESSGCNYLEDLISCVHIIQLKCLSCIRVGKKQKKVDIDIPKSSLFIHQIYINASRKLYKNIYLFEQKITPLEYQRNQNMLEIIIKESIINSIRENIPVDNLLKLYLEEQDDEEMIVNEEIIEEREEPYIPQTVEASSKNEIDNAAGENEGNIQDEEAEKQSTKANKIELEPLNITIDLDDENENAEDNERYRPPSAPGRLTFSDIDRALNENNTEMEIQAPKNIEHLEKISNEKYMRRMEEEALDDVEEELDKLRIDNSSINLDSLGIVETL
jgi:hypothetical protein